MKFLDNSLSLSLNWICNTPQFSAHANPNNMVHYTFTVNFHTRAFTGKNNNAHGNVKQLCWREQRCKKSAASSIITEWKSCTFDRSGKFAKLNPRMLFTSSGGSILPNHTKKVKPSSRRYKPPVSKHWNVNGNRFNEASILFGSCKTQKIVLNLLISVW